MKSIIEKSFELFPEMQTDSDDWDVIEEQCDRDDQRKAFVKGANYVLEEIETIIKADLGSYKSQLDRIKNVIKQLKK